MSAWAAAAGTSTTTTGRTATTPSASWTGAGSGWWSGSLTPFFNYGLNKGLYTNDHYLNSVMAGWEFGPGDYTAHSWGAVGF